MSPCVFVSLNLAKFNFLPALFELFTFHTQILLPTCGCQVDSLLATRYPLLSTFYFSLSTLYSEETRATLLVKKEQVHTEWDAGVGAATLGIFLLLLLLSLSFLFFLLPFRRCLRDPEQVNHTTSSFACLWKSLLPFLLPFLDVCLSLFVRAFLTWRLHWFEVKLLLTSFSSFIANCCVRYFASSWLGLHYSVQCTLFTIHC